MRIIIGEITVKNPYPHTNKNGYENRDYHVFHEGTRHVLEQIRHADILGIAHGFAQEILCNKLDMNQIEAMRIRNELIEYLSGETK